MCQGESRKTYARRLRTKINSDLINFRDYLIKKKMDSDFLTRLEISPKGCNICSYAKKYAGAPVKDKQPKKNKQHNSTLIRLTYKLLAKKKLIKL